MKAPKILPWIAKRAGISEQLALKLWRRASGESALIVGNVSSPDFHRCTVDRFLSLVDEETASAPQQSDHSTPVHLSWLCRHQNRVSLLSLIAAQNTYRLWQYRMASYYSPRKAA